MTRVGMAQHHKVTRAFGALFAIPIAVSGVVLAAYLVLLGWTTLLRVKCGAVYPSRRSVTGIRANRTVARLSLRSGHFGSHRQRRLPVSTDPMSCGTPCDGRAADRLPAHCEP
jgi:hypothetical protein